MAESALWGHFFEVVATAGTAGPVMAAGENLFVKHGTFTHETDVRVSCETKLTLT